MQQAMLFTGLEHSVRMCCQGDVRAELGDPLVKDYFRAVGNIGGWSDGDPFYVSYIGHPVQGAVVGFIEIQNDTNGMYKEWGADGYWKSRLTAMAWSAVYGAQFKIGLISEAMIGHVGLPNRYRRRPDFRLPPNGGMSFDEFVTEPVGGTGWLVLEDILDRYVMRKLERRTESHVLVYLARSFLSPARSAANLLRFKYPWRRDSRDTVPEGANQGPAQLPRVLRPRSTDEDAVKYPHQLIFP